MAALDRDRLARILGMLGSEHDGEVVAAARQAERMRKAADLSWDDILNGGGSNHGGERYQESRYEPGYNPFREAYERARDRDQAYQDRRWQQEQQEANQRRRQENARRNREAREQREREAAEREQAARAAAADAAFAEAEAAFDGRDDETISAEEQKKIANRITAASFSISVARKFPMRFTEQEKLFLEMVKNMRGKISENQVEQLRRIYQKARVYAQ